MPSPFPPLTHFELSVTPGFDDYRLIDSGRGRKLERFGAVVVDRPEPQAMWSPRLDAATWEAADAVFAAEDDAEHGRWRFKRDLPDSWPIALKDAVMICQFGNFRHLGLFPEQLPHWDWMQDKLGVCRDKTGETPRLLNLFAYTGAASLLAASAGAEVTHVDASKKAIEWAKLNQVRSDMTGAPIRWILEDARKFVQREVRRGRTYHGILADPPKFGRGPNGEVWDVWIDLAQLLRDCASLLEPRASFMVLTSYAIRASTLATDGLMREVLADRGGSLVSGELAIQEENGGRLLPTSLYTRWMSV